MRLCKYRRRGYGLVWCVGIFHQFTNDGRAIIEIPKLGIKLISICSRLKEGPEEKDGHSLDDTKFELVLGHSCETFFDVENNETDNQKRAREIVWGGEIC